MQEFKGLGGNKVIIGEKGIRIKKADYDFSDIKRVEFNKGTLQVRSSVLITAFISHNIVFKDADKAEELYRLLIEKAPHANPDNAETPALTHDRRIIEMMVAGGSDSAEVNCPKCGSTSLSANKKDFSAGKAAVGVALTGGIGLLAGAIGSNKVQITCLKCGNQFMAGKG